MEKNVEIMGYCGLPDIEARNIKRGEAMQLYPKWFGEGIYFFTAKDDIEGQALARKYPLSQKNGEYTTVLSAIISGADSEVLDLVDDERGFELRKKEFADVLIKKYKNPDYFTSASGSNIYYSSQAFNLYFINEYTKFRKINIIHCRICLYSHDILGADVYVLFANKREYIKKGSVKKIS